MCVRVYQTRKRNEVRTILLVLEGNAFLLDPLGDLLGRSDLGNDALAVNCDGNIRLGLDCAGLLEGDVIARRSYRDELPDVGKKESM